MASKKELEALIAPVVESFGCELWGIDFTPFKSSALLRVFIDKASGITLDDCSKISYQLSGVLDVEDPVQLPYRLEVSSPGVERPLLRPEHYQRYQSAEVKIRLKWPVDGQRNFTGSIESADEHSVVLRVDGEKVELPFEAIGRGRLVIDFTVEGGSPKQ
ncbi:MAG TPA: ribosome maturation factor RimP [Chromatiales bacterium]|nr:ribosome maturation factor RimP [Thiotrichales bacterium]HIP68219.1 ribosome maturation factor RimP [Chromatiales bacterium]